MNVWDFAHHHPIAFVIAVVFGGAMVAAGLSGFRPLPRVVKLGSTNDDYERRIDALERLASQCPSSVKQHVFDRAGVCVACGVSQNPHRPKEK